MMNYQLPHHSRGTSLTEVLITILILLFGILGFSGLQMRAQTAEMESYQRAQALILIQDMVDRINANRKTAACYNTALLTEGYLGTGVTSIPGCSYGGGIPSTLGIADRDFSEWDGLLKGASEINADASTAGAMMGARGCINYDATNDVYTIVIAWQGLTKTAAPSGNTCAQNLYGDEKLRRTVSSTLRIASLT